MATVKLDPAKGVQIPNLSTTERNAISSPETGALIWNTTTSKINQYNGSAWQDITIAGISSSADATAITIDSNENVGIGITSPLDILHLNDPDDDCVINLDTAQANKNSIVKFSDPDAQGRGFIQYNHTTDSLRTHVAGTERTRIHSDGVLSVPAGVALGVAASSNASSNTLDDYEEGTWTPAFTGTGGASGQSYSDQSGHYTKIGNKCFCSCNLQLSTKGTISGFVKISGMPFTVASGTAAANAGATTYAHKWDLDTGHVLEVWIYNTDTIYLMQTEYAGDAPTQLTTGHMQNTTGVKVTFSYTTG